MVTRLVELCKSFNIYVHTEKGHQLPGSTPGKRMKPFSNISVIWIFSLCHKNMFSVWRLCFSSLTHVSIATENYVTQQDLYLALWGFWDVLILHKRWCVWRTSQGFVFYPLWNKPLVPALFPFFFLLVYFYLLFILCRRRLVDTEDELSDIQSESVPSEVRDWLASTFTRQMGLMLRRNEEKPRFRSIVHAVQAGIFVER